MKRILFKLLLTSLITGMFFFSAHAQTTMPAIKTPQDLAAGRARIDSLDNLLMKVLGERERMAQAIGVYKAKNHMPPLAEARFKEVMNKSIEAGKKEGLSAEFITELMNAIHKESLRIESDSTLIKH